MSHNFNRGDLVQVIRTAGDEGIHPVFCAPDSVKDQMGIVVDGSRTLCVQVQLFTGDLVTIWPAHLKKIRRPHNG